MNSRIPRLIREANAAFSLSLQDTIVLTEAATGNYVVTPVIAALAGAEVFAFTRDSRYGSVDEVKRQTSSLAEAMGVDLPIRVVTSFDEIPFDRISIVTNTGFLRPLDAVFIDRLPLHCVIPLMWETWEFRASDINLNACRRRGIKVYGTNEEDGRLRTKEYLGYLVLERLLSHKRTPFSTRVLILGCDDFSDPVQQLLAKCGYQCTVLNAYEQRPDITGFDVFVVLEHKNPVKLIGPEEAAFFPCRLFKRDQAIIHVCGEVEFSGVTCTVFPEFPAPFGHMSLTTDYIDPKAVIDLHTAGFKVAEGMLEANRQVLKGKAYRAFMEENYPAQGFEDEKYW